MPIELCHPYPFWLNTRISLSSFHAKKIKIKIYMYWHYQNTNRIEIDEWRSGRNIWFSKQLEHFCLVCMTSSSYIWKRISFSCLRQQTRNNTMPAWTTKINGKCIRRLWRQADIQLLSIYRNSVLVLIFSTDKLECYSKMLSVICIKIYFNADWVEVFSFDVNMLIARGWRANCLCYSHFKLSVLKDKPRLFCFSVRRFLGDWLRIHSRQIK